VAGKDKVGDLESLLKGKMVKGWEVLGNLRGICSMRRSVCVVASNHRRLWQNKRTVSIQRETERSAWSSRWQLRVET